MNKYMLLGILVFILVFITYIVDISTAYTITGGANSAIDTPTGFTDVDIWSMVQTFFGLLTFQISEIPAIINLFVFYPITVITAFMIIDVLKDLVPFT